jgi:hypothetical protein
MSQAEYQHVERMLKSARVIAMALATAVAIGAIVYLR